MKNMIRCYLDANVLIFLQDKKSPFYNQAVLTIKQLILKRAEIFTSSLSLDEFLQGSLRFSRKTKQEMKGQLKIGLKKIFSLPQFRLVNPPDDTKRHMKVVDIVAKYNLRPRDAYHLFIMQENKIKYLATFDHDFDRVFAKGTVQKFPI